MIHTNHHPHWCTVLCTIRLFWIFIAHKPYIMDIYCGGLVKLLRVYNPHDWYHHETQLLLLIRKWNSLDTWSFNIGRRKGTASTSRSWHTILDNSQAIWCSVSSWHDVAPPSSKWTHINIVHIISGNIISIQSKRTNQIPCGESELVQKKYWHNTLPWS